MAATGCGICARELFASNLDGAGRCRGDDALPLPGGGEAKGKIREGRSLAGNHAARMVAMKFCTSVSR
jgi:hypothetical protein